MKSQQLVYKNMENTLYKHLNMLERVSRGRLQHFFYCIIKLYGDEYLCKPTTIDIQLLYATHE